MNILTDIITSIENAKYLVKDPHAIEGTFLLDEKNRPIRYTGGFSVIFPYENNNEKWGFRCWHTSIDHIEEHYYNISNDLSKSKLPYFCDFTYVKEAILVNGKLLAATRMKWIEGLNIKDYICKFSKEPDILKKLSANFLKLCKDLHKENIAHGDLQHGNILVDKKGNLFLVDYDSLATPSVFGRPDIIIGLKDYQHPSRNGSGIVNEKLDYFSEVIIYTSIIAISQNPNLADKYKLENSDRMLFSAEDYRDIERSSIISDLKKIGGQIPKLIEIIKLYLQEDSIDKLVPFEEILFEPKFDIKVSLDKIRRGQDNKLEIKWNITNTKSASLRVNDKYIDISSKGSKEFICNDTTKLIFTVINNNNKKYELKKEIPAYNISKIKFSSDKSYTLPKVPVILKWEVEDAKKVTLLGIGEVQHKGEILVEPDVTTIYTLEVKDTFDTYTNEIKINILPLPRIEFIKTPIPNIEQIVKIDLKYKNIKIEQKLPTFNISNNKIIFNQFEDIPFQKLFEENNNIKEGYLVRINNIIKSIKNNYYAIEKYSKNIIRSFYRKYNI